MAEDQRIENARIIKGTLAHDVHELAVAVDKLKLETMKESLADMRRLANIVRIIKEAVTDKLY